MNSFPLFICPLLTFQHFESFDIFNENKSQSHNPLIMRREYKVESFIYYSKLTTDRNHILKDSTEDVQKTVEEYGRNGWKLVSTDATSFGAAVYIYLNVDN